MPSDSRLSRRAFFRQTAAGATACSVAGLAQGSTELPPKNEIRIGVRFGDAWLHSRNDGDLRFFKQIGVDWVAIELVLIN